MGASHFLSLVFCEMGGGGILAHSVGEETQVAMIESLTSKATLVRETSVALGNMLTQSLLHISTDWELGIHLCGQQKPRNTRRRVNGLNANPSQKPKTFRGKILWPLMRNEGSVPRRLTPAKAQEDHGCNQPSKSQRALLLIQSLSCPEP